MDTAPSLDDLDLAIRRGDLRSLFTRLAESQPAVEALVAPGRPPLTYGALPSTLAAIKAALNGRALGCGDRIVIAAVESPDVAACCVAVAACAVAAPINPAYSAEECAGYLERLRPAAAIVPPGAAPGLREAAAAAGLPLLDLVAEAASAPGAFRLVGGTPGPCREARWNGHDDVVIVLHSSGTTARQKLVPVRARHVVSAAADMRRSFALGPGDRSLHVMPLYHGHGLRAALLQPLIAGSTVVSVPRFVADDFLAQLRDNRITWYSASYAIHRAVLDLLRDDPGAAHGIQLRFIRSGSGRLDPAVMAGLEAALGTVVIERYGGTETGTVAVNRLPPGRRKPGSVGTPEGNEIVIRAPQDGRPLPAGAEGEVTIRGPGVVDGYLDDPEATAAAFVDGWFRTGDLGRFDADGYLTITGRLKELINRGGEKVSPGEVEAVLARHPAIRAACVFAIPHPRLGEEVAAAVIAADGAVVDEDDVADFAAASLAEFKVPRRVFFLPSFALGATYKIDRRAVARQCLALEPSPDGPATEPAGSRHAAILDRLEPLWRTVLRRDAIPRQRDFFLLGGDSLSAAQLVALIAREFRIELPLRAVFREARTLTRMAATIAGAVASTAETGEAPPPIAPRRPGDPIPLSFAQEQIWLHDRLQTRSTAYTVNRVARLRGRLDVVALAQALSMVADRHEILRSTIAIEDGTPRQVVHPPRAVPVPLIDLSRVADAEREATIAGVVATELRRPFDLAAGPLLRAALWRFSRDDHVLVLALHHILIDGGGMRALTRELVAAYRHLVDGGPPLPPPPPPIQFGDFALWDRREDARGAFAAHLVHWRRELDGVHELDLPTDRPRPRMPTATGQRLFHPLARVDVPRLRLLARADGGSLFGVLIAAVQVLLHRFSGATDIVIGTPFSRRSEPGLEGVVGPLMNMLPIRADLAGDPGFRAFLRQVTARILGAIDHQAAPLTRILDAAGIRRSPDRHPLFQVVALLAPRDSWTLEIPGLSGEMIAADDGSTKFDLTFAFVEQDDRLELVLQYDADLFDRASAERFASHLERLLDSIAATPDLRVSELETMPAAERRLLLDAWSGIAGERPVSGSIAALFAEQARARPAAPAIVCGPQRISYAELDDWSTRLAHRLRAAGVGHETVVGLAAGRTPALLAAELAILKAGGAFLPLDPGLPASRLAFMLKDAGVRLVLALDAAMAAVAGLEARILRLDAAGADLGDESAAPIASEAGPRSLAYVMYTSGSTGTPKGVAIEQRGVIRLVRDTDYARFGPDERFLQLGSVAFDVSTFETWGALLNGGCVVQVAEERPALPEIGRIIVAERVTTAWFTAGLFNQMVDHVLDCFAGVGQVLAGGEIVSVSHARRFRAAHPNCRLINGYGPTEATTFATAYTLADDADLNPSVPIGRPIANTRAYVLDPQRKLVPIGAIGELCLGGAGIARGYLNRPELTAERFVADPFAPGRTLYRTGDLVRWRNDGTLQFIGRIDRQVKLRGFRIEPVEIETALQGHPAVDQAVVTLRRDADGDARLVAFCVLRADAAAADDAALRAHLRERLPHYMIPTAIAFLPALPLTAQGKVDLKAIPEVASGPAGSTDPVAPRTPFEAELVAIWRDVLGVERVGVTDDFFALGGHSLLAVKMLFRVWDVFAVELPLSSVFEMPTIEGLALALLDRLAAGEGDRVPS